MAFRRWDGGDWVPGPSRIVLLLLVIQKPSFPGDASGVPLRLLILNPTVRGPPLSRSMR
jgi:hypothetical protein